MIWDSIRIALKSIRANKMRSILTTLGIIIGVAAVVAVVSVVQGLNYVISEQFEAVGGTYVMVIPFEDPNNPDLARREVTLTYEDGLAVLDQASRVSAYDPVFTRGIHASYRDKSRAMTLMGVGADHQEVANHWVDRGRFFSRLDMERRASVCLIGEEVISDLELGRDPLGTELSLGDGSCTVIGVMEGKGELFGQNQDRVVIIPITTAEQLYGRNAMKKLQLTFQAASAEFTEEAKDQITRILRDRHDIPEEAKEDFVVILQEEILKATGTILGTVTLVVAAVVGIALLVGGIGIMNIMLVSVTERTREIGIRKAVGARRTDILLQFLIEAVTLSVFGGLVGILGGAGLGKIVSAAISQLPPAHVPAWAVILAFAFAALVGVIFGTYPAAKASRLDPIEALRYE